ncbi:hypothetical protein CDAR_393202 [Caerostris darwini]|uniref:Defensin n=1 Tax=Caerostris darwini TaxID=1538125 RepID=A0AAV4V1S6_9ARAC|nr:hypothetical protein CDAR_393202 [Caerostris darwini]
MVLVNSLLYILLSSVITNNPNPEITDETTDQYETPNPYTGSYRTATDSDRETSVSESYYTGHDEPWNVETEPDQTLSGGGCPNQAACRENCSPKIGECFFGDLCICRWDH